MSKAIDQNQAESAESVEASDNPDDSMLGNIFSQWRQLDERLGSIQDNGQLEGSDEERAQLLYAQTVLMNTAAALPGKSYQDLLYKLSLWRRDAPELPSSVHEMERHESLVYSAYRDLVELTGNYFVATELDRKTNMQRSAEVA